MNPRSPPKAPAPLKRLGQNFLVNPRVAEALVDHFAPGKDDLVVEIGPGRGVLTTRLASRAGRFLALEKDERLLPGLRSLLAPFPAAEVRLEDALEVNWGRLGAAMGGPLRVIGNLPYNAGTAIVRRLLASPAVRDIQVVLQKEVVDRFLAAPRTKEYGPLSVVSRLRARAERLFLISPGSFRPAPKVTSAALRLTVRDDAPVSPEAVEWLFGWLFCGFGHRRKMLAGNLAPAQEAVRGFLAGARTDPNARAEELSPELWLALAHFLDGLRGGQPL